MQFLDWLLVACITLPAIMTFAEWFIDRTRNRTNLLTQAALAICIGSVLISTDRPWAGMWCIAISFGHLALVPGTRKKSPTK